MPSISQYADQIVELIREDITEGVVPAEVRDYSDLHGHVDANEYPAAAIDGEGGEEGILKLNAVTDEVNRHIKAGDLIVHMAETDETLCNVEVPANPDQWVGDYSVHAKVTCTPCRLKLDEGFLADMEKVAAINISGPSTADSVHYAPSNEAECGIAELDEWTITPEEVTCGECIRITKIRAKYLRQNIADRKKAAAKQARLVEEHPTIDATPMLAPERWADMVMVLLKDDVTFGGLPADLPADWSALDRYTDANFYFERIGLAYEPTDERLALHRAITDEVERRIAGGALTATHATATV